MIRFLLPACLFMASLATAQNSGLPIICGNEALDYIVQRQYPELQQTFQTSFEENLADSIILSQMAVLNEDYNRENADTSRLRAAFKPVAGNPQIHFDLVEIKRIQTSATFKLDLLGSEILANLKSGAQGGSDAEDPNAFLNIWICKIQPIQFGGITIGQILGFAFPPNNLGHWPANSGAPSMGQDGVALDFRVIGRNNPNPVAIPGGVGNLVVRGRTACHEIGHYLGLRHIWGDGGLLGPNDCNQSDGINDTPFASAQSPFDCDTTRNSCPKVETFYNLDMPDLIENYMDYSSEDCMNMFTQGQVAMIQSVLAGPRKGLVAVSSNNSSGTAEAEPQLFPNPARNGHTWLHLPEGWQPRTIELIGIDGRVRALSAPEQGARQVAIDTRGLAAGWYVLRLRTEERVWVSRLAIP